MKKLLISTVTILVLLIFPSTAFAASAYIVSGPTGIKSNGWYWGPPSVVVDSIPSCPTGKGTITLHLSQGAVAKEGLHHITLRNFIAESWLGQGPYIAIQDKAIPGDTEIGTNAWACSALGIMGGPTEPETIWEGDIKWDSGSPSIIISSPSNNSNTDGSTVTISGTVSDAISGVQSVKVNGINAGISGGSFSASIPVSNGLNTLIAVVTDYAGHTAQAQVVVNKITSCGNTGCSATTGSTQKTNSQKPNNINDSDTNSNNQSSDEALKEGTNNDDNPTLVKGVVKGGGIGLATIFAFIIILLILDKFRIIEIKAFAKISDKFSKGKSTKKTSKKSS
jgi:hypothetical protein